MKCPRCLVQLKAKSYEQIAVDQCGSCQGVWLDLGELELINRNEDETFTAGLIVDTLRTASPGVSEQEVNSTELCPKCSKAMNPINFNYSSGVVIDICPSKHGLWFDHQELEKVQIHWEHWEKQREEKSGAWGDLASLAKHETYASLDKNRERTQRSLGIISRTLDKIIYGIEKSRRS